MTEIPEPDRVEGAPHPRATLRRFGQEAAERRYLAALAAGRRHHAWLLSGPRGVGKATLAWAIARAAVAGTPGLDLPADHPVVRRSLALSEPRLLLLRRPWDEKAERLRTEITVDEVRRLRGFLELSAPDGGTRAVIVDAADEMNAAAANALLKLLEEPPPAVLFLLVSHQPGRLLPTIRSRCRDLRLAPLGPADLAAALAGAGLAEEAEAAGALAELSGGSAGEAVRLAAAGGPATYADLAALLGTLPRLDRGRLLALAESLEGREAAPRADLLARLLPLALARIARAGAAGRPVPEAAPGEAALARRLAPDLRAARAWAEASQRAATRLAAARAVNLDPARSIIDTFLDIEATAQRAAAAA